MAEITLESFLADDSSVKAARKKLAAAKGELANQKNALAGAGTRAGAAVTEQAKSRIAAAEAEVGKAQADLTAIESKRSAYFNANKRKIQSREDAKSDADVRQRLDEALAFKSNNPQYSTPALDNQIADLTNQLNKTGKYAPVEQTTGNSGVVGDQQNTVERDYLSDITNAALTVRNMSPDQRRDLSELLKAAGYDVAVTNVYNDNLVANYQQAIKDNMARSTSWKEEVPWNQFIQDKIIETSGLKRATGEGDPRVTGTLDISNQGEAEARVEKLFQQELNRLPTPDELAKFSNRLIKEESKKSSISKAKTRKVGGVTLTEYTGGLDKDQFLVGMIRKMPEYDAKKVEAGKLTLQTLQEVAADNGLDLNKNFGQSTVNNWVERINNGEKIDTFSNLIRQTAKVGLPERVAKLIDQGTDLKSVYAPYQNLMETVLELPRGSVDLNDPTLRAAITVDKEMPLYDFEKNLRKDSRWQYTNNARQEVSDVALKVLKDFGFMG
jgi:hypothetical protein